MKPSVAILALLFSRVMVWGALGQCPDGPLTDSLATLGSTGCANADKNFINFGLPSASASGLTLPSTSDLFFYFNKRLHPE